MAGAAGPRAAALGELLRRHRERRGLTQEQLAERVGGGLSVRTVSNLERGRTRPYAHTLAALATALGLDDAEREALLTAWHGAPPPGPGPLPTALAAPLETPFVGRATEHARLVACFQAARSGRPQVASLEGEAGIGKTRLAAAFLDWAQAQGGEALVGRALETTTGLPYHPLVDALRRRLGDAPASDAPEALLGDVWLAELSRLLPELRNRHPDLPAPTADETAARPRLFEALARLVQALAQRAPVVLFVDDVQWADPTSLDVLRYALRRWQEDAAAVLLLLTLRAEALATAPALADWVGGLARDAPFTRLTIGRLTADDTAQLVRDVGGQGPRADVQPHPDADAQFGRWLFAETAGQPFFIAETLRALLDRGVAAAAPDGRGHWRLDVAAALREASRLHGLLPPGVQALIGARLARLTPAAFALVVAGAVLGHDLAFARLCRVAGLDETAGLAALDEAVRGRLLEEARDAAGRSRGGTYQFTHDKVRESVYGEAGEARRRVFHGRALEALAQADVPAAELARHALAAGLSAPAFRHSVAAGDAAMQLFAVREAAAHYEQARALLGDASAGLEPLDPPAADLRHLYLQLGRAYELGGDSGQARATYEALLAAARERGWPALECAALNRLATLAAQDAFDLPAALALLRQALGVAEAAGEALALAETLWNQAQLAYYAFDLETVLASGTRALAIARDQGAPDLVARSLNVLAYARLLLGDFAASAAAAEEARALYAAAGDRAMEADCLCLVGQARIFDGDLAAGLDAARAARAISVAIENRWGQAYSALPLAVGLLDTGAFDEARRVAHEGVAVAREAQLPLLLHLDLVLLGIAERAVLAIERARAAHLEALEVQRAMGEPVPLAEGVAAELCADCALAGDWAAAYRHALQVGTAGDAAVPFVERTLWHLAAALLRGGDAARAEALLRRFAARIGDSHRRRIPYLCALATLARGQGDSGRAVAHLQEAAALADAVGLAGERWQIDAALAAAHRACGDEERAAHAEARSVARLRALADQLEDAGARSAFLTATLAHIQSLVEV